MGWVSGGIRSILFLKQCGVRQVPAGFVRRVDQPTVEMRRMIGRTIEMGAVPARFMMQEPASSMIPGHQAIIEPAIAASGRRHPVLVGGASRGVVCNRGLWPSGGTRSQGGDYPPEDLVGNK